MLGAPAAQLNHVAHTLRHDTGGPPMADEQTGAAIEDYLVEEVVLVDHP